MKKNRIFTIFFLFFFLGQINKAYCIQDSVDNREIEKLLVYFKDYDSILLFQSDSYWRINDTFSAIAFKKNTVYHLSGFVKRKKNKIKRIILYRLNAISSDKLDIIKLIDLDKIYRLNDDSLNNFTNCDKSLKTIISDGITYTLIGIKSNLKTGFSKNSYMIETYQRKCSNKDRQYYLDILNVFEKICNCKLVVE